MTWIYVRSEPNLWTVGFYDPQGRWHADSDFSSPQAAAERVHWLNGGPDAVELNDRVSNLEVQLEELEHGTQA